MILDISRVLSEQHDTIEQSVPVEMEAFRCEMGSFALVEQSLLSLCIAYVGDKQLEIIGRGEVTALIPCDRCLADVRVKIPLSFCRKVSVDPEGAVGTEELDEANYIDGYNFDVEQLVYNELLTGWPTKILCREDCKGLCGRCGRDLNKGICDCEDTGLDLRMSVIRDVFKNFKEV